MSHRHFYVGGYPPVLRPPLWVWSRNASLVLGCAFPQPLSLQHVVKWDQIQPSLLFLPGHVSSISSAEQPQSNAVERAVDRTVPPRRQTPRIPSNSPASPRAKMSFGIGVGDIILLTDLAWSLWKNCKEAPADFARLSTEILSLHAVLSETKDFLSANPTLDTSRRNRLTILCDGCDSVLKDLDAVYKRFDSLPTQSQRAWDRLKFGLQNVSEIRDRLVSSTTLLGAWNSAMTKCASLLSHPFPPLARARKLCPWY